MLGENQRREEDLVPKTNRTHGKIDQMLTIQSEYEKTIDSQKTQKRKKKRAKTFVKKKQLHLLEKQKVILQLKQGRHSAKIDRYKSQEKVRNRERSNSKCGSCL